MIDYIVGILLGLLVTHWLIREDREKELRRDMEAIRFGHQQQITDLNRELYNLKAQIRSGGAEQ